MEDHSDRKRKVVRGNFKGISYEELEGKAD